MSNKKSVVDWKDKVLPINEGYIVMSRCGTSNIESSEDNNERVFRYALDSAEDRAMDCEETQEIYHIKLPMLGSKVTPTIKLVARVTYVSTNTEIFVK